MFINAIILISGLNHAIQEESSHPQERESLCSFNFNESIKYKYSIGYNCGLVHYSNYVRMNKVNNVHIVLSLIP